MLSPLSSTPVAATTTTSVFRTHTKLRIFTQTPHMKSKLKQFLLVVILNFLSEKGQRIHRMSAILQASDDLRNNALSTVQYAEFGISSCNLGQNESINIGKHLVPFLSTYMPHLQTLRLWRPDDFPWTTSKFISFSMIDNYQRDTQLHFFLCSKHFFL